MSVLDAFSLSGKVSVVTGANRGIGRALVTALAEAGSDVVLLVRDTVLPPPVATAPAGQVAVAVTIWPRPVGGAIRLSVTLA